MNLIAFDVSRIVYLTMVHRPTGGPYLPEAATRLVQRYSFARYPNLDELSKDTQSFSVGKFKDVQINELSIYNDGIIVAGRCSNQLLDEFIEDLFDWAAEAIGLIPVKGVRSEKHFESAIVVQSDTDLAALVSPDEAASNLISSALTSANAVPFRPSGAMFDCDPEAVANAKLRRKPSRFSIERRLGLPFSDNFFYCQAPLKTDDHLEVLRSLEGLPNKR